MTSLQPGLGTRENSRLTAEEKNKKTKQKSPSRMRRNPFPSIPWQMVPLVGGRARLAGSPMVFLSGGVSKNWPGVTNSASNFDPRKFLQSQGPHSETDVASMRRALLYRSRQTGWLETDIIMGRWAADNIDKLSVKELQEYAKIVKVRLMQHSFSIQNLLH